MSKSTMTNRPIEFVIIVDRSGSMSTIKNDMEKSLQEVISNLPKTKEVFISLFDFDTEHREVYSGKKDPPYYKLEPRGGTALFDAIGRTLNIVHQRNGGKNEVQVLIITDGEENSSKEFKQEQIAKMIAAEKGRGTDFVFLGANQDAILTAKKLNIDFGKSMTFEANAAGTASNSINLSRYYTENMTVGSFSNAFTKEERQRQVDAGAKPDAN